MYRVTSGGLVVGLNRWLASVLLNGVSNSRLNGYGSKAVGERPLRLTISSTLRLR